MGKTSYDGPVFGAKSLLWSVQHDRAQGSTVAVTMGSITVPAGEDWLVTDLMVYRGSTHSTASVVALTDDSTQIADVAVTSSLAGVGGSTAVAKDTDEYIGKKVATGSVLALTVHDGGSSLASAGWQAWVYGYPRWLQSSTRGF
jgi:hypothetical protein